MKMSHPLVFTLGILITSAAFAAKGIIPESFLSSDTIDHIIVTPKGKTFTFEEKKLSCSLKIGDVQNCILSAKSQEDVGMCYSHLEHALHKMKRMRASLVKSNVPLYSSDDDLDDDEEDT